MDLMKEFWMLIFLLLDEHLKNFLKMCADQGQVRLDIVDLWLYPLMSFSLIRPIRVWEGDLDLGWGVEGGSFFSELLENFAQNFY